MFTHTAFIGIGSNLGDRLNNCREAIRLLGENEAIKIEVVSKWYETKAIKDGLPAEDAPYINGAAKITTSMPPRELMAATIEVEKSFGRPYPRPKGEPRAVDLDILLFDNAIIREKGLTIPHPEMEKRLFVLIPLCDIASKELHPVLKKPVKGLKIQVMSALDGKVKDLVKLCSES